MNTNLLGTSLAKVGVIDLRVVHQHVSSLPVAALQRQSQGREALLVYSVEVRHWSDLQ